MRWFIKCAVDNLKGLLPGQSVLRDYKRRIVPYKGCSGRADFAIEEGIKIIRHIRSLRQVSGAVCMELGSGWEPLIPILFSLCGAEKVLMTDLHRLCTIQTFVSALTGLRRNLDIIAAGLCLDSGILEHLSATPKTIDEAFRMFRLEYLAPCDCTRLPLASASVDVVFSRAVLEHVEPAVIERMFLEAKRVLVESGLMCHLIDPSDHWQHGDRSISRINFLRYSDPVFRLTHLNSMNYHNRVRHSEFAAMVRGSGFEIVEEESTMDPRAIEFARTARLARKFQGRNPEDLAIVDSFFLATAKSERLHVAPKA